MDDYYKILGLPKGASQRQIKEAYRELAKRYHPDHDANLEWIMQQINEAYSVLSNPQKRRQYDSGNYSNQSESSSQSSESSEEQEQYNYQWQRSQESKDWESWKQTRQRRQSWFSGVWNWASVSELKTWAYCSFVVTGIVWGLAGARPANFTETGFFIGSIVFFACSYPLEAIAWPFLYGFAYLTTEFVIGATPIGAWKIIPIIIATAIILIFAGKKCWDFDD